MLGAISPSKRPMTLTGPRGDLETGGGGGALSSPDAGGGCCRCAICDGSVASMSFSASRAFRSFSGVEILALRRVRRSSASNAMRRDVGRLRRWESKVAELSAVATYQFMLSMMRLARSRHFFLHHIANLR